MDFNANAFAGGGCFTEHAHQGKIYKIFQRPALFFTYGFLRVIKDANGYDFAMFIIAHELAHLERRLSRAIPSPKCANVKGLLS
jgi:hypothetical protein